jgi:hypothetical protein
VDILTAIGGVKTLFDLAEHVRKYRANAPMTVAAANEVVVNLWGSLLFEMRDGCEFVRKLVHNRRTGLLSYAMLSFQVSDAIFPEFCRLVPAPAVLAPTARLLAELREIDHFQRAARPARDHLLAGADPLYDTAIAFGQAFLERGGVNTFNDILAAADAFARAVYEKEPNEKLHYLLPKPIDPAAQIPR